MSFRFCVGEGAGAAAGSGFSGAAFTAGGGAAGAGDAGGAEAFVSAMLPSGSFGPSDEGFDALGVDVFIDAVVTTGFGAGAADTVVVGAAMTATPCSSLKRTVAGGGAAGVSACGVAGGGGAVRTIVCGASAFCVRRRMPSSAHAAPRNAAATTQAAFGG